jgi:hypothetical protein
MGLLFGLGAINMKSIIRIRVLVTFDMIIVNKASV